MAVEKLLIPLVYNYTSFYNCTTSPTIAPFPIDVLETLLVTLVNDFNPQTKLASSSEAIGFLSVTLLLTRRINAPKKPVLHIHWFKTANQNQNYICGELLCKEDIFSKEAWLRPWYAGCVWDL